jgi:hypothetical protein
MPGGGTVGSGQIPFDDRQLLISAFDHKPTNRIVTHDPANLALEFLQTGHTFSVERLLGKASIAASWFNQTQILGAMDATDLVLATAVIRPRCRSELLSSS